MNELNNNADLTEKPKHAQTDKEIIGVFGIPTRIKPFGEKFFDWGTYGGVGFVANEITSVAIKEHAKNKHTKLNHWWESTEAYLEKLFSPSLEKFSAKFSNKDYFKIKHFWSKENLSRTLIKNPLAIFILTLGGNLMVIPIRMLESVKDPIVQKINEMWYGYETANSETMQNIRAQMNDEPQQTWATQIKSRLVTLFGAVGIYLAAGTPNAPSTWLLNDTKLDRWSSLDRIGTNIVRKLERAFHPENQQQIASLDKASPYEILKHESKFAQRGATLFQVLTLSAVFSFIFYLSTRVFARKHDEKLQLQHKTDLTPHSKDKAIETEPENKTVASLAPAEHNTPSPRIQIHENHGLLAQSAQIAAAAG